MNRTGKLLAISALALVAATGAALAEGSNSDGNRRGNFFERLFQPSGKSKLQKKRRRTLFGDNWWDRDGGGESVRIINGQDDGIGRKRRRIPVINGADPEGDPGIGMGNLTYVPDKAVPLTGFKFAEPKPVPPEAAAIYDALSGTESPARVTPAIRDAVAGHYRQQNFAPLWTREGSLSPRANALLKLLAAAADEGLEPSHYLPPSLTAFDAQPPAYDPAAMARLDVEITARAMRYARDASGGQFDPRRLSLYNDVSPAAVPAPRAIKVLAWSSAAIIVVLNVKLLFDFFAPKPWQDALGF